MRIFKFLIINSLFIFLGCSPIIESNDPIDEFYDFFTTSYLDSTKKIVIHEENYLHRIQILYSQCTTELISLNHNDRLYYDSLFEVLGNHSNDSTWNWSKVTFMENVNILKQSKLDSIAKSVENKKINGRSYMVYDFFPQSYTYFSKPYFNKEKNKCIILKYVAYDEKHILVFLNEGEWYLKESVYVQYP